MATCAEWCSHTVAGVVIPGPGVSTHRLTRFRRLDTEQNPMYLVALLAQILMPSLGKATRCERSIVNTAASAQPHATTRRRLAQVRAHRIIGGDDV